MQYESNMAGDMPQVHKTAYIHRSAAIIGNVHIGANVFVGPQVAIRADEPGPDGAILPIVIEAGCNVQDGVILHALAGTSVTVEEGSSLAHGCIVHGPCTIGKNSFIGFNSVIFDADLGVGVVVMHAALVEGVTVPEGLYIPSMSAVCCSDDVQSLSPASPESLAFASKVSAMNIRLTEGALGVPKRMKEESHD